MLTFDEKLSIIESFPELERRNVSLGRVNFHFENSKSDKKNIVYHLHPNGNGFVYAGEVKGVKTDSKGLVNIREYSEEELRVLIKEAIYSLTPGNEPEEPVEDFKEIWVNADHHILTLVAEEEDLWNVYAGPNLDGTFTSYKEAAQYLDEEGFHKL
ncbi:hypothetical protein [Bacillus ectoiniformans]|uniref:hypothetical protein n=1 Tax=Bacillus ectoiniformans TaxID=1494429 RepID=UPI00195A0656|nr:hypothetical protein [Bacillus ectoiniformans]